MALNFSRCVAIFGISCSEAQPFNTTFSTSPLAGCLSRAGRSRRTQFCAFLRCFSGKREKDQVSIGSGWWQWTQQASARIPSTVRSYFPCRTSSGGSARPRSRAIPPTPRPRGRLSVLAFCGVARGAEVPRVRSRADSNGGVSRGCSSGVSGFTGLAAAAAPARAIQASAGVRVGRRCGRAPADGSARRVAVAGTGSGRIPPRADQTRGTSVEQRQSVRMEGVLSVS